MADTQTNICLTCTKQLPSNGDYVTCDGCKGKYHFSPCTSIAENTYARMAKERKAEWRCSSCRSKYKGTTNTLGKNQQMSTRTRINEEEEDIEKTLHANAPIQKTSENNKMEQDIKEIKKMIASMMQRTTEENKKLKEEICTTVSKLTTTVDKLNTQVAELTEMNNEKEKKIRALENKINEIEQKSLVNNIEISNIPKSENENQVSIIQTISSILSTPLETAEVADIFRNKKQNIIIKLISQQKKKQIIRAAKINKDKKIYANDQLTAINKKILWLTKTAAKLNNWKFVWVKEGKICARKEENSNIIYIREEGDIKTIS